MNIADRQFVEQIVEAPVDVVVQPVASGVAGCHLLWVAACPRRSLAGVYAGANAAGPSQDEALHNPQHPCCPGDEGRGVRETARLLKVSPPKVRNAR